MRGETYLISSEKVTIAVITYNGEHLLEECLSAVKSQSYPEYEIIVVDNNSTDRSVDLVKEKFPEIKILQMKENRGPNPARNAAILKSDISYTLLVDDDAVLTPDCLRVLMKVMKEHPDVGICHPRVVLYDDHTRIQYDGTRIYYIGAAILKDSGASIEHTSKKTIPVSAVSGVTMLVKRDKALHIGLFDEDYFFGWTDTDFSFRMTISGFKCLNVPQAIVYHKMKKRGLSKAFYQVRNRWYFILKNYSSKTLFFLFPILLVYELSLLLFLAMKGELFEYLRANLALIKNFGKIMKKRKEFQPLKKVSDREVLCAGDFYIREDLIEKKYLKLGKIILNRLFNSYWKAIKNFI